MSPYRITSGPTIDELISSLAPSRRVEGCVQTPMVALTIPVGQEGDGGWIWDGSSDQVSVRMTLLERIDEKGDGPSQDWRFKGTISSCYKKGLDGTPVEGRYSTTSKTGTVSVVR